MKRIFIIPAMLMMLILAPIVSNAAPTTVPPVIGFHSAVYDEGGNLLGDGEWGVKFRITDADGAVLYEERQDVSAMGGRVSTLIGNGLTADGAPTGGIPIEAIDPSNGLYLEAEFDGMSLLPAMELASVPYAAYSEISLGAADGSIVFDALAEGLIDKIGEELTDGAGKAAIVLREELDTMYNDTSAASTIGVATDGIASSTASDLQGALVDFDAAISTSSSALSAETTSRINGDNTEADSRVAADNAEANARAAADSALDNRIAAVETPLRLSFSKSIWGTVHSDASFYGANASASSIGMNRYQVSFTSALSSANYAVVATPNHNTDLGANSPATIMVYDKTSSGFKVAVTPSGSSVFRSFDFIVMGN